MTFYHQSSRIVVCCLKWAMFWQTWLSVCSLHYGVLPLVLRAAEQNKHFICPQWRSCYHGPCSNYCHYCKLSAIKYLNSNKSSWHISNVAKYRSAPACPGVSAATGATHATAVKTGYKDTKAITRHWRRYHLDSVPTRPAHLGCAIFQTFCRW